VQTPPAPRTATISGRLSLGAASRTFDVSKDPALNGGNGPELVINAVVSQPAGTADGITKVGTGTLLLGAVNTYTGPTVIGTTGPGGKAGGTLRLGVANAIPSASDVTLANSGALDLNGHNDTVGNLNGAAGTALALGTGVLTTNGGTFSGTITGTGGLTKVGTGVLTVAGADPAYTGTTTVNGGTLTANGNLGASTFVVNSGATLGGTGTVGAATVNSGGTLSPGGTGTIGTLNASGNTTLTTGATFLEEVNSAASFDKYNVTGSVALGGSTLQFSPATVFTAGTQFKIITATAGFSGNFKDAQGNTLANGSHFVANGQDFTIAYNANDVTVTAGNLASTTTLTSQPAQPTFGQPVTFTATVTSSVTNPGGTVTFFVDGV
jgi:fibronectin-binding autotransporter adhesin